MSDKPSEPGRTIRFGELTVEIPPEVRNGLYSNLVIVNHSPDDFILDFCFVQPGTPQAQVRARVAVTPTHFKRLVAAMQQNLERFEATFGRIEERTPPVPGGTSGTQTIN